jgi:hypothetical protein
VEGFTATLCDTSAAVDEQDERETWKGDEYNDEAEVLPLVFFDRIRVFFGNNGEQDLARCASSAERLAS